MNKTLYIKPEHAEIWAKARKYIMFYEDRSLSDFIAEQLQAVVDKYEAKP